MKRLILVIVFIFSNGMEFTYAAWLCEQTASIKNENTIIACGIGEASTESLARTRALRNAQKEFKQVCDYDYKCRGFETSLVPLRNSCEIKDGIYKCVRGMEYTITDIPLKDGTKSLDLLNEELEIQREKYELEQEKFQKEKELLELKRKIKNGEFEEGEPSSWNNRFQLGLQLDYGILGAKEVSSSSLGLSGYARYIPRTNIGLQLKRSSIGFYEDTLYLVQSSSGETIDTYELKAR